MRVKDVLYLVFVSKPLNERVIFVEDAIERDGQLFWSYKCIDFGSLEITTVKEELISDIVFSMYYEKVLDGNAWESSIESFMKALKESNDFFREKRKKLIEKDRDFIEHIIGNTYKNMYTSDYCFFTTKYNNSYDRERDRAYCVGFVCVNAPMGKFETRRDYLSAEDFDSVYAPCRFDDFINELNKLHQNRTEEMYRFKKEFDDKLKETRQ